jgi:SAM-dependent methyltransferase
MTMPNQTEYDGWNGENGRRWIADADRRDRILQTVSVALLKASGLQHGDAVLDVGCGCGATTIAAASIVGPTGTVLGVDISEVMLGVARRRVAESGLARVSFVAADAQTHPFERAAHDVAISRFGTMFFDDPVAAFVNLAGALRPAGRLCLVTWQPLAANDWLTIPGAALLEYGTIPEAADGPGMFAQSDPISVAGVLRSSGFSQIDVTAHAVPMHLGADPEEATDYLADTGMGRAFLATVPPHQQGAALDAVRNALRPHRTSEGVTLDAGVLIISAVKA